MQTRRQLFKNRLPRFSAANGFTNIVHDSAETCLRPHPSRNLSGTPSLTVERRPCPSTSTRCFAQRKCSAQATCLPFHAEVKYAEACDCPCRKEVLCEKTRHARLYGARFKLDTCVHRLSSGATSRYLLNISFQSYNSGHASEPPNLGHPLSHSSCFTASKRMNDKVNF